MKTRWAMVIATFVVAGCATPPSPPPPPPATLANDCRTPNGKCDVAIRVTEPCNDEGKITVDPEILDLAGKKDVTITWELPTGYRFCQNSGDKVTFKYSNLDFQFYGPEYDDNQGGGCFRKFKWKDKNEAHTAGTSYSYLLQFTGPNGACKRDPFIRNG